MAVVSSVIATLRKEEKKLKSELGRIRSAISSLESGGAAPASKRGAKRGSGRRGKRRISAAGRKAISDAQKARWAKVKAARR